MNHYYMYVKRAGNEFWHFKRVWQAESAEQAVKDMGDIGVSAGDEIVAIHYDQMNERVSDLIDNMRQVSSSCETCFHEFDYLRHFSGA